MKCGADGNPRKRNSSSEQVDHEEENFLTKPSAALQKLFQHQGSGSVIDILQRPVMSFVLQWNDLESLQIAMTQALRKAACRTYALQALNWLLRSVLLYDMFFSSLQ